MPAERERLPDRRFGETHKFSFRGFKWFATVGFYEDGRVAEVFIKTAKAGSLMRDMTDDMSTVASLALQYGCPVDVLVGALTRTAPADDNKLGAATPLSAIFDKLAVKE